MCFLVGLTWYFVLGINALLAAAKQEVEEQTWSPCLQIDNLMHLNSYKEKRQSISYERGKPTRLSYPNHGIFEKWHQ